MGTASTRPVLRSDLAAAAQALLQNGYRLAAITGCHDEGGLRAVYTFAGPGRVDELVVSMPLDDARVPSMAALSYPAGRFEREVHDMFGIEPVGHPLPQRLVLHGHWPQGWHPMRHDQPVPPHVAEDIGSFPFLEVEGTGVYEIPVGPVHAGLIEPGHFRFSVVGETILRMKARLWFVHRGIEKLFEGEPVEAAIPLAERVSGDTAVGHTLALLTAIEDAAGLVVDERARRVRAVLLELERMYNHVADLGALATDVGFGIAGVHAQRLRERLLRLNRTVTGHRLLRGGLFLGGARLLALPSAAEIASVATEIEELAEVTLGQPVVLDRFTGTAVLTREQAEQLGTLGYVARASGLDADARRDHPLTDLGPRFEVITESGGDVLARYQVRRREAAVSAAVITDLLGELASSGWGSSAGSPVTVPAVAERLGPPRSGVALVEGWRGTICHRVELRPDGRLSRVRIVDPSFLNWPALPVALADTIVPDFPLANKSFNQSYAGNDL